nr:glycosyltransferase family 4 protein [Motilibacter aurantiacus]
MPSAFAPSVGGVEVLSARLAVNLRRAGHDVEIWTASRQQDDLPRVEVLDGLAVRRFVFPLPRASAGAALRWPAEAVAAYRELAAAARAFRPDLLHVQCFSAQGVYAAALSRRLRRPLVVSLQGETVMDDQDIYDSSVAMRTALRIGVRQAAAVTGCSQFTLDDSIRRFGLSPAKSQVIFNGVDVDEAPRAEVALPFDRFVLGLGRVVHKKGFDLLLDAFAKVAPDRPDVGLVIVGGGAELDRLKDHARRLGLEERVFFPGPLGRGQVADVMHRAEVFVMPSRVEPFGIVALEGWRAGTPVVVTSRGGAGEFVQDGRTGRVVDPEDTSALADAVAGLLDDPALRASFAAAGRARLPEFSWDRLRAEYEKVYASAAAARR